MLDYVPDDLTGANASSCGQELTVVWESENVPEDGLLLQLIAASRATIIDMVPTDRMVRPAVFQPERISGFCAV